MGIGKKLVTWLRKARLAGSLVAVKAIKLFTVGTALLTWDRLFKPYTFWSTFGVGPVAVRVCGTNLVYFASLLKLWRRNVQ